MGKNIICHGCSLSKVGDLLQVHRFIPPSGISLGIFKIQVPKACFIKCWVLGVPHYVNGTCISFMKKKKIGVPVQKYESWSSWMHRGMRWLSGRVSDCGARDRGFETYRRSVVSLSKTLYSPKVLVNYPGSSG